MSLTLVVTRDADEQIEEADLWWRENRPKAENRVQEELSYAFALLLESPGIGSLYFDEDVPGLRRFRLRTTPYFLYYSVDEDRGEFVVVALWSGMRGKGPPL